MSGIINNPTIVVPAIAWFIAQSIKLALRASKGDFSLKYLYKSGNMPSSHSAVVLSLLVTLGFLEGFESSIFGVALAFSSIVLYDALNVRRAVGEQGGLLARLIEHQRQRAKGGAREGGKLKLIEVLGHTPIEVAAGALIGLIVGFLLMLSYWPESAKEFFTDYRSGEDNVLYGIFVALILLSFGLLLNMRRQKQHKLPSAKRVRRAIYYFVIYPSLIGIFFVWSYGESITLLQSKWLVVVMLFWVVIGSLIRFPIVLRDIRRRLAQEAKDRREAKRAKRKKRRKK